MRLVLRDNICVQPSEDGNLTAAIYTGIHARVVFCGLATDHPKDSRGHVVASAATGEIRLLVQRASRANLGSSRRFLLRHAGS